MIPILLTLKLIRINGFRKHSFVLFFYDLSDLCLDLSVILQFYIFFTFSKWSFYLAKLYPESDFQRVVEPLKSFYS